MTVTGDGDRMNETVTLTHAVVGAQSRDEYDGAANQTLTVNVSDDDVELSVRPQAVTVQEGTATLWR